MSKSFLTIPALALSVFALCLLCAAQEPSLGDLAREARKSHSTQPVKVYTNEDIPRSTSEVIWRSAVSAPPATAATAVDTDPPTLSPIKVRSEDVECNFSFRAQPLVPHSKPENAGVTALPASEVAKLDGTASIWGDTLDVSIHNDTGWSLREVTVRLLIGGHGDEGRVAHSHPAGHGDGPGTATSDPLLALRLSAEPHTATVSSELLSENVNGQEWSWEIVQAKGIPPK